MVLEEAKERLQSLYEENADLLSGAFKYAGDTIYIDEDLANEYLLENEAIETILQELEHLQKENEELKGKIIEVEKENLVQKAVIYEECISKEKIRQKIAEIEKVHQLNCGNDRKLFERCVHEESVLLEILKEE